MKKLFVATIALLALNAGGSALAADLRVKARPLPPPPPVYSWTGCYIGVNGGYGIAKRHRNDLSILSGGAIRLLYSSRRKFSVLTVVSAVAKSDAIIKQAQSFGA